MCFRQTRDLDVWLLSSSRGAGDHGRFGDVVSHRKAQPPEKLDPLRDLIHELALLLEMLIKEQVELIEGVPGGLPVMLLIQVPQGHGVGEELVEELHTLPADLDVKRDWQLDHRVEWLRLVRPLVNQRLGPVQDAGTVILLLHRWSLLSSLLPCERSVTWRYSHAI